MFSRSSDEEFFHRRASITQAMQLQRQRMMDEINRVSQPKLANRTPEDVTEEIAKAYSIDIPVLDEAAIIASQSEIDIDLSRDPSRFAYHSGHQAVAKGTRITIKVPFTGDAEVFRLHAGNHTMEYPRGRIGQVEIEFRAEGVNLDSAQVRREFDGWLAQSKRHLAGMAHELGSFNSALKSEALNMISARAAKLKRDADLVSGLGFGSSAKP